VEGELAVGELDLDRDAVDQAQVGFDAACRDLGQGELAEQPASAFAEGVAQRRCDAVLGEDGVDLALEAGTDPHQACPHAGEPPRLSGLRRGDPGLGQQVAAKQVGQHPGIHGVVLDPPSRDGLGGQRVSHVGRDAGVRQQVGQPAPSEGGLEGHLHGLGAQFAEHAQDLGRLAQHPPAQHQLTALVERGQVRPLAMKVDSDVHHGMGLQFGLSC